MLGGKGLKKHVTRVRQTEGCFEVVNLHACYLKQVYSSLITKKGKCKLQSNSCHMSTEIVHSGWQLFVYLYMYQVNLAIEFQA